MFTLPWRARRPAARKVRATVILSLEALEDRTLLAGTASPMGPVLGYPISITSTTVSQTPVPVSSAPTDGPNNPLYTEQWDLNNTGQNGGTAGDDIQAAAAWAVTTGNPQTTVAVIDTGIDYNQPDLYDNIWINQAEIPKSRLQNLVDYYHDGYISFRDLNYQAPDGSYPNQGPGKIMAQNGGNVITAADILAPMVLTPSGQDTGYGGWAYPGNTQDGDTAHPNDFIGWNFVDNNNNPFDDNGHGTNVAGTIGAMGGSGVGVAGINWQVSLMAVKFLDANGNGDSTQAAEAINYAVAHGAKLMNCSWGGSGNDPNLAAAVNAAQAAGDIIVAAAGNSYLSLDTNAFYPASFVATDNNVVTVAATDSSNNLACFSNYGPNTVDLAAPGVDILSTMPNDTYGTMSGTSQATPHVTGVLALVYSLHPDWTYQQVIDQVLATVTPVSGLQGMTVTGGELDAAAAVGNPVSSTGTGAPASTSTTTPLNQSFVTSLYQGLLNRAPDPTGLAAWMAQLQAGMSRAQVAQAFWQSPEHYTDEVTQYYQTFLHRAPDAPSLTGWVNALLSGVSELTVMQTIITSTEYSSLHPDTTSFVTGLYEDVLGRAPDPVGLSAWTSVTESAGRAATVAALLASTEALGDMVNSLYETYLGRAADPTGLAGWIAVLQTGQASLADVATQLLGSQEYFNRT